MPKLVAYATFGAEIIYFAVLFARVVIKRRHVASMPA